MTVPPPGPPAAPRRYHGWRLGTWIAVLLAVVVETVACFVAAGLVSFLYGGVCNEPAGIEDLREGRRVLLVVTAVAAGPWLLALIRTRHRLRLGLLGLVAVAPALLITAQAWLSSAEEWTSGWCLY